MSSEPPKPKSSAAPSRTPVELVLQNPCQYPETGARRVRPWLEPLLAVEAPQATSFVVRFVSDREMRRLNRTYRGKDRPTDVLSFPAEDSPEEQGGDLGDVVISVPTARRQAMEHGHGVERELKVLMLHGLLHCLGYDHEVDEGEMERLERRLRRKWIPTEADDA